MALHDAPGSDPAASQPDFPALVAALQRAEGFSLLLAQCNTPALREKLLGALAERHGRPLARISLGDLLKNPERSEPIDTIIAAQARSAPVGAVLSLEGLETALPSDDPERAARTLQEINLRRSAYQRLGRPLLLWLPEYALNLLAREAPDFHDWYSGAFSFAVEEAIRAFEYLPFDWAGREFSGLSAEERGQHIETLTGLLAEARRMGELLLEASIRRDLGRLESEVGNIKIALVHCKEALAKLKRLDDKHAIIATLDEIVRLLEIQGKPDEARVYLCRALKIQKQMLGPDHPDVAMSLVRLAKLLYHDMLAAGFSKSQSNSANVEFIYHRALAIQEKALGPGHPCVVENLIDFAVILDKRGKREDSTELRKRILTVLEALQGDKRRAALSSIDNLVMFFADRDEIAEVGSLYLSALLFLESVFGFKSPDLVLRLIGKAMLFYYFGINFADFEPVYRKALAIRESALGSAHPHVARDLINLAVLLQWQKKSAEAEQLFRRALAIWEKALGPKHSDVAFGLSNFADLLANQGRLAEAESLYQRALGIFEYIYGVAHPHIATINRNLARLLRQLNRPAEAAELEAEAARIEAELRRWNEPMPE